MTKRNPFAPPSWHAAVAAGDFSALPDPLRWDETIHMALLIDGYSAAGGNHQAATIYSRLIGEIAETGDSAASPLELWIALFFSWRRQRFIYGDMTGDEVAVLDCLCTRLRQRLRELSPDELAVIMGAMATSVWPNR